jgi:hypothetical protein
MCFRHERARQHPWLFSLCWHGPQRALAADRPSSTRWPSAPDGRLAGRPTHLPRWVAPRLVNHAGPCARTGPRPATPWCGPAPVNRPPLLRRSARPGHHDFRPRQRPPCVDSSSSRSRSGRSLPTRPRLHRVSGPPSWRHLRRAAHAHGREMAQTAPSPRSTSSSAEPDRPAVVGACAPTPVAGRVIGQSHPATGPRGLGIGRCRRLASRPPNCARRLPAAWHHRPAEGLGHPGGLPKGTGVAGPREDPHVEGQPGQPSEKTTEGGNARHEYEERHRMLHSAPAPSKPRSVVKIPCDEYWQLCGVHLGTRARLGRPLPRGFCLHRKHLAAGPSHFYVEPKGCRGRSCCYGLGDRSKPFDRACH